METHTPSPGSISIHHPQPSGVVSGTTVRALVLGRFSQKKIKIELKDNAKKMNKNISYYKG